MPHVRRTPFAVYRSRPAAPINPGQSDRGSFGLAPDYRAIVALRAWIRSVVRARLTLDLGLDPDDLTAEVLLRAVLSWARFEASPDDPTALRRWVSGITHRTIAERSRNARTEKRALREYQWTLEDPALQEGGPVAAQVEARDLLVPLCVSTAPENWRAFVGQHEGRGAAELAAREGVSVPVIHWRIREARQSFKATLRRIEARERWRGGRQ